MKSKEEKIEALRKLVNQFRSNINQYKIQNYNEANIRVDFIDKFFELLDWDVRNEQGFSEQYREVVREDRLQIEGKQKAPDYSFRIGGVRKFFVEAKKPSVYIKKEIDPAYQVRRYGYTAKLPLSILTNFEEFAVYDTRIKPSKDDDPSIARIFYCTYEGYENNFDFIYNTFSKNAILKGSFDKYIEENKNKKGTSEVDKELLKLVEEWRKELAKNIALRNNDIDIYNLNIAVQKIIDRIIFLRIAEDKDIEEYEQLFNITKGTEIYKNLNEIFIKANNKYNAGLFKSEEWLKNLTIEDKVLSTIIKSLYYPECPYEFSILPIEILGNIYEQFLGKTITFKNVKGGHTIIVEDKPEVKKAGGVYYTPQHIVNYIIQNSIGEKIKNKTPEEISKVKICDPACGSGSFLVAVYQYLLNYHLEYYTTEKNLKKALKEGKIYQISDKDYNLAIEEKQRILLNNIYGIDIDLQAVEVTKLSLYLKLLENEGKESKGFLFKHSDLKLLPDLDRNIKCGNSLIGNNFYKDKDLSLFDKDTMRKINAFDWEKEFEEIFKEGGFDIVIGNPPYIQLQKDYDGKQKYADLYEDKDFEVFDRMGDIYCLFYEKGIKILKQGGILGYITSNKWMRAGYGKKLRKFFLKFSPLKLIDLGPGVFESATVDTNILIIEKSENKNQLKATSLKEIKKIDNSKIEDILEEKWVILNKLNEDPWFIGNDTEQRLKEKIERIGKPLKYWDVKIYYGIKTGLNEAFIITTEKRNEILANCKDEDERKRTEVIIKPILRGREIKRYYYEWAGLWLIIIPAGWTNENRGKKNAEKFIEETFPSLINYLKPFESKAKKRDDQGDYWWELRACSYYPEFEKEKLVYSEIVLQPQFYYDTENYYVEATNFLMTGKSVKYLCGLLNSNPVSFFFKNWYAGGGLGEEGYRYKKAFLENTPLPPITPKNEANVKKIETLVDQMLETQKLYHNAKTENDKKLYKQKIDIIDNQIDELVYQLYDLNDEEIKIIEEPGRC